MIRFQKIKIIRKNVVVSIINKYNKIKTFVELPEVQAGINFSLFILPVGSLLIRPVSATENEFKNQKSSFSRVTKIFTKTVIGLKGFGNIEGWVKYFRNTDFKSIKLVTAGVLIGSTSVLVLGYTFSTVAPIPVNRTIKTLNYLLNTCQNNLLSMTKTFTNVGFLHANNFEDCKENYKVLTYVLNILEEYEPGLIATFPQPIAPSFPIEFYKFDL